MTIYLLVDPHCLIDTPAETITDPATIPVWRKRIENLLAWHPDQNLTIRINLSFLQRLADFEGMHGVIVQKVIPHVLLEKRLECSLPEWLQSEVWQVALCRLSWQPFSCTITDIRIDIATWRVLAYLDANLIIPTTSVDVWLTALSKLVYHFPSWLHIAPVQSVLSLCAPIALEQSHLDALCAFFDAVPTPGTVEQIRVDVLLESLRDLATLADSAFAPVLSLPPRRLPSEVLQRLKIAPPNATDELERLWRNSGEHVVNLISQGILKPDALARIASVPWPSWWAWLADQIEQTPELASAALVEVAQHHSLPTARNLASLLQESLQRVICPPWPIATDVPTVLTWCTAYLPYARARLIAGREPDAAVAKFFARWLLTETARIQRSGNDWRKGAECVTVALRDSRQIVIVILMDALGMLDVDLLLDALTNKVQDTNLSCQMFFAPMPTLTEVGKMAVLTGQPVTALPADRETALRHCYHLTKPDDLCLIKGFTPHPQQMLTADTKLCVYLNDQVDDSLHQDDSYASHRERVRAAVTTLALQVAQILGQVRRLDRPFILFITADHGATAIASLQPMPEIAGRGNGRTLATSPPPVLPDGYEFLSSMKTDQGYLVPLGRFRPSGGRLTHGGLTPEEVLIPWITITKQEAIREQQPSLRLMVPEPGRTVNDGWTINIHLENLGTVTLEQIVIVALAPFFGESLPLDRLPAGGQGRLTLNLRASVEQPMTVEASFEVHCRPVDATQRLSIPLQTRLTLKPSLIQHSKGAQRFNEMFD